MVSGFWAWLKETAGVLAQPEAFVTFVVVAACVAFVFDQFDPSLLFNNATTISGGDTGAHVLLPWVAEHQLLSNFRLTGWTSSNWDGFPAVTFYFPLPIYSIVAFAQVVGYNVAFKLLTAAPMILTPLAAWAMGRLARAPFPTPAVLAAATLPFIFGSEFSIYGGNILSTLAGEFAFGWSLCFAMVFFGLVIHGLQSGRHRAWAAVAFACSFMSHIDPAMFAAVGAIVLIISYAGRSHDWRGALWWSLPTLAVGGFLAAWWALPFYLRFPYVTNMGYQRITTYMSTLFPTGDTWVLVLAAAGAVLCLARRRRIGEFLTIMGLLSILAFRFMPQSILWNARVLPFWFLILYLLAALAVAELYAMMMERTASFSVTLRAVLLPGPLVVLLLSLIWVGLPLHVLPGEHQVDGNYEFLGIPVKDSSQIPSWISWNYSGYQAGCPQACAKSRWPEYEEIVAQLEKASKTYGCGNVMWEYQAEMNNYGTPDALTILPYWTNGCIGSMEGLYYEASATTPFHFIDQSELSLAPSDPMVGLPYAGSPNVTLGVEHLQMLGVKYYMALNTELQQQAAADPSLKLISTFGPYAISGYPGTPSTQTLSWKLYLVLGSPRVHPLANQPVVMEGLNNSSQPRYLNVMTTWYDDPSAWDVYLAASGPSNWARVAYGTTSVPVRPEPTTKVTDIVEHNSSISFNVSRLDVPVVVTISYFPNWQVSGAADIYRVSPNLMVVVPTSHHVRLWYGETPVDYAGWFLTLIAIAGLVLLVLRPLAPVAAVRRPGPGRRLSLADAIAGEVNGTLSPGSLSEALVPAGVPTVPYEQVPYEQVLMGEPGNGGAGYGNGGYGGPGHDSAQPGGAQPGGAQPGPYVQVPADARYREGPGERTVRDLAPDPRPATGGDEG
jgi:hypothetical protein